MKFDLSWGNSVAVRSALLETLYNHKITTGIRFEETELASMNYTSYEGDPELISHTKKVIERQVGSSYKHILITNGASGAVTISLRTFCKKGCNVAFTHQAPYFPVYPAMIEAAGLVHKTEGSAKIETDVSVALLDSPTNPQGHVLASSSCGMPVIWDAVYHNNVYTDGNLFPVASDVLIGSYSKLLGLNGLRAGWIATNDSLLYERLKSLVVAEYCGLSWANNYVLNSILREFKNEFYWEKFETKARMHLDYNREEWSKLEKYFCEKEVGPIGMFYYSEMDQACKRLLEKSSIVWTKGSQLGVSDDFGRFNLGQDVKIIRQAVREILYQDTFK